MFRFTRALPIIAAALIAGPLMHACSEPDTSGDPLIEPARNDPALAAATRQAVSTLDVFWSKFDTQAAGTSDYFVKLRMTGQDGYVEYIWAEPVRHSADEVVARLANDPVHLEGLELGSEVRAPPGEIADWSYTKNSKMYGHFTSRALAKWATPEQRAGYDRLLAPTPLEPVAN